MKKIILTAVMAFILLYVDLIDFSYAEDHAKGVSEFTGVEMVEKNVPIILAQGESTTGNEERQDPYDTEKVGGEEDEEDPYGTEKLEGEEDGEDPDDTGFGQVPSRRERRRQEKAGQN